MVSITIVSQYGAGFSLTGNGKRKIAGEPLYRTEGVLELLTNVDSQPIVAWTRKCVQDAHSLGFDQDDLCELLRLVVSAGQFRGAEWCIQRDDGPWAACDAYSVVRQEWVAKANKEMRFDYYLKFAISKSGEKILLASCHLS